MDEKNGKNSELCKKIIGLQLEELELEKKIMRKNFVIHHQLQDTVLTRFQYVVDFMNAHPLKPADFFLIIDNQSTNIDLFYGDSSGTFLTVPVDTCFLEDPAVIKHFFSISFLHSNHSRLHAVSNRTGKSGHFFQNNCFGFDLFNTLFFHISRYEEYYAPASENGQAGWLAENRHFLIQNNLHEYPVVDQLLVAFFEIVSGKKIEQKSTYSISHDVDILTRFTPGYKFFRSLSATILQRRRWSQFMDSIIYYKKMIKGQANDPYNYFATLLREEEVWKNKYIFMMTGGNTKYDNKYRIDDPTVKKIIQMAANRGYSLGLHPSYNAGFEVDRFAAEQKNLANVSNQSIINNRQHWLRWSWKITPYLLEENGIAIDSTMGYSRHLGFRCGTGFPYQMYDFKNEKTFSWTEYPMAFMESSAIHQAQINEENLPQLMRNFLLNTRKNTHLMLNFHNSNFDPLLETGQQLRYFYENELLLLCCH